MFLDVPNDIEIHVGDNEEKKNVLAIGMKELEDKNVIIKL
jgi:hypothetical protein